MPNHTENNLLLRIPTKEEASKIRNLLTGDEFLNGGNEFYMTLSKIVPPPKEGGSREWNIENWGTKWDCYASEIKLTDYDEDGILIHFYFETAWSPPFPVIEKLAELFPDVSVLHRYADEGGQWEGVHFYKEGWRVYDREIVPLMDANFDVLDWMVGRKDL